MKSFFKKTKITAVLASLIGGTGVSAIALAESPAMAAQSGWVYNTGQQAYNYYGSNGKKYTGWHYMTKKEGEKKDHWNYFGADGRLYTGWQWMDAGEGEKTPHWSYFGANGWLRTGWVQLGKGTSEPDGNTAVHWSYFGPNGWLRAGWQEMGQGTDNPDGNNKKHWSYFGSNGWLRTGWVQLGKGTSEPDGNQAKHFSYFGPNGWLRTGLQNMGKGTSNPDGNNVAHKSYFGDNGWLVTDKAFTYSGISYKADSRGWLSEVKKNDATKTPAKTTEKYTVTFTDGNGKTLSTQTVEKGKNATAPANPVKEGYTFNGWDKTFNNVSGNITVHALWKAHKHDWQPVYKTVHHDAITHKEEKRTPITAWSNQTNAIQIYGNLGSVSPAFYQVIKDDLEDAGMDYDDLYGIYDKVPAFGILEELQEDLSMYSDCFWRLYTADEELYQKCLQYLNSKKETMEYLYSSKEEVIQLKNKIKKNINKLRKIELGELTDTGKKACDHIYSEIDKITDNYEKLYNKGFPDPDGDGKRGHRDADRSKHNQFSLYFNETDFGKYVGYVLHLGAWRQTVIDKPGWYKGVLVETVDVVDKPAWDEKVIDHYKCACGITKR